MEDRYRYHGMEELFRIELGTKHEHNCNLDQAAKFSGLSRKLKSAFRKNHYPVSGQAWIHTDEDEPDQWRIVDERKELIRAYFIRKYYYEEVNPDKKSKEKSKKERKYYLQIYQDTPSGRTKELWQEKVFQMGIPFRSKYDHEEYIYVVSADEDLNGNRFLSKEALDKNKNRTHYRRELQKDDHSNQKKKWDYFFRPHNILIGKHQKKQVLELENEVDKLKKQNQKNLILYGSALVAAIGLGTFVSEMIFLAIPLLILVYLPLLLKFQKQKKLNEKWIRSLTHEIKQLYQQVPTDIPSDEQMEAWFFEEIQHLKDKAIEELILDRDMILEIEGNDPWGHPGITIPDWGAIQPKKTNGRERVNDVHLKSFRVTRRSQLLFAVYYIQFIFLTKEQIAIYNTFYDFILGKPIGYTTHQYHYQDVVSIGTSNNTVPNIFDENSEFDITLIQIAVSNNNPLQIALTDEKVIEDINKRIEENKRHAEQQAELEEENLDYSEMSLTPNEAYREVSYDKNDLPYTKAFAAMGHVRREWTQKKETLLSK